jgi:hypothetical protein
LISPESLPSVPNRAGQEILYGSIGKPPVLSFIFCKDEMQTASLYCFNKNLDSLNNVQ